MIYAPKNYSRLRRLQQNYNSKNSKSAQPVYRMTPVASMVQRNTTLGLSPLDCRTVVLAGLCHCKNKTNSLSWSFARRARILRPAKSCQNLINIALKWFDMLAKSLILLAHISRPWYAIYCNWKKPRISCSRSSKSFMLRANLSCKAQNCRHGHLHVMSLRCTVLQVLFLHLQLS